jgi:predicted secreted protein
MTSGQSEPPSKDDRSKKSVTELVFREENNGARVQVGCGSLIKLELEENPTTGYQWMPPIVDPTLLALERDEFHVRERAAIGGGGIRQFIFRAKGSGEGTIQLIKKRPWQSDEQSVARFTLSINIQNPI